MLLEIILILFIVYSVFISYAFITSLRRINQFESYLLGLQQIIEFATEKMKSVDSSGHYSSDDETGFFFKQLKDKLKRK